MTIGLEGLPRDGNERGLLAAQIMAEAAGYGIPEEDIWLDPLVLPIKTQQMNLQGCTDFIQMVPELFPACKSACGLSNISDNVPRELRAALNRTYLVMLKRYGLYSAIVNAFDEELRAIADGKRPDVEALVHRVMDGEPVDLSSLSFEEAAYVKTTKVIMGQKGLFRLVARILAVPEDRSRR